MTAKRPGVELATSRVASQRPNHYTTRSHTVIQNNLRVSGTIKCPSYHCSCSFCWLFFIVIVISLEHYSRYWLFKFKFSFLFYSFSRFDSSGERTTFLFFLFFFFFFFFFLLLLDFSLVNKDFQKNCCPHGADRQIHSNDRLKCRDLLFMNTWPYVTANKRESEVEFDSRNDGSRMTFDRWRRRPKIFAYLDYSERFRNTWPAGISSSGWNNLHSRSSVTSPFDGLRSL